MRMVIYISEQEFHDNMDFLIDIMNEDRLVSHLVIERPAGNVLVLPAGDMKDTMKSIRDVQKTVGISLDALKTNIQKVADIAPKERRLKTDTIEKLWKFQFGPFEPFNRYHPLTCPNRGDGNHREIGGDLGMLVPTRRGLICPFCDYVQTGYIPMPPDKTGKV